MSTAAVNRRVFRGAGRTLPPSAAPARAGFTQTERFTIAAIHVPQPETPDERSRFSPATRAFADALLDRLRDISEGSLAFLVEHIQELEEQEDTQRITMAALYSVVELGLTMVSHDIDVNETQAPATAMAHTRHVARQGTDIDGLLRYYRLTHAHFWQWIMASPALSAVETDQHAVIIQELAAFSHRFIDIMSSQVTAELLAEQARTAQVHGGARERTLAALAAGEEVTTDEAAEILGISGEQHVVCVVSWMDTTSVDDPGLWLGDVAGTALPLVLRRPDEPTAWWLRTPSGGLDLEQLRASIARGHTGGRAAVGGAHAGVAGVRASYEEAVRARRVAELMPDGPAVVAFADIVMVDLLTRDLESARAFAQRELGGLATSDARDELLRHTVRTFFELQCAHASAAAALGVHRNTLRQRLERASERRGAGVATRQVELQAALLLAAMLPDLVLESD